MSSQLFLYAFFTLSALHVLGELMQDPVRKRIRLATKPLLMPALIAYNLLHTDDPNWWIVGGLLLGWVGDVVLMYPKVAVMFLIGLASFLVGHALYIYAFLESTGFLKGMPLWFMASSAVFAFAAAAIFLYFKPHLTGENANKKIPVALYSAIILAMSYASLAIWLNGSGTGVFFAMLPFVGSVFFIVSDIILAQLLFVKSFRFDKAINMTAYLAGQYFIAQSYLPYPFS
ncbi:MAG: hypothetical protein CMF59_02510 [Leptospiraceae bacterium]|nr:hypothetical protein [Leptospiraceae bacterium]